MISFCGEYLPTITSDLAAAVAARLSPGDIFDFSRATWPGARRTGWTFPGTLRSRGVRLGSLYWPRDASRWAVAYLLATDQNLNAIRSALASGGDSATNYGRVYGPGELVLSEENEKFKTVGKLTATMYMLPPRPLLDVVGQNGTYLLTLVDDRFFWWFSDTGVVSINPGNTTWTDLFDQIAEALGIDILCDNISANYLTPGTGLAAQYEQTPLLLDAVAYNVGQRIVVDLDGTVHSYDQESSQALLQETLYQLAQDAPQTMFMTGGGFISDQDKALLLPSAVRVVFPCTVGNVDVGQTFEYTVKIGDLNLASTLGILGNGNVKTFHTTCAAEGATGSNPTNLTTLTTLATQIATDWYLYQLGPLDAKFEGIVNWSIEGLSDSVEWTYVKGEISTRVMRPAWNDLTEELLHGIAPAPQATTAWIKVINSASQTITLTPNASRNITGQIFQGDGLLLNQNADFTDADLDSAVSGTGIPGGTKLISISSPSVAIMSNVATATLVNVTVAVTDTNLTTTGYPAVVERWNELTKVWEYWDVTSKTWITDTGGINWGTVTSSVWLRQANGNTLAINERHRSVLTDEDENGEPVYDTGEGVTVTDQTATTGSPQSLSTSWANVSGLSLVLPKHTTWKLDAQLNAVLSSSAGASAGDYISCRYYDGTTVYGQVSDFCTAACSSSTYREESSLKALIAVGSSDLTVNIQGIINTSSSSTATLNGLLIATQHK